MDITSSVAYLIAPIDVTSPTSMVMKLSGVVFLMILARFVTRHKEGVVRLVDNAIRGIDFTEKTYHTIRVSTDIVVYFVLLVLIAMFLGFKGQLIQISNQPLAQRVLATCAILLATWLAAEILRPSIKIVDDAIDAIELSEKSHNTLERVLVYSVWLIAIITVMGMWGITGAFAAFLTGGAVMGFAVGYAAKDLLANVISGLFVFIDKPFKAGDAVDIGSKVGGTIERMGLRTTTIRSFDGLYMVMPNQKLAQERIVNYSRSEHRRVDLTMGMSYDSDVQKAILIMNEVPLKVEGVETDKGVTVFLDNFGDYSINFIARYWIDTTKCSMLDVKTEVANNVKERFAEEGIDIPYPTRVTLRKNLD